MRNRPRLNLLRWQLIVSLIPGTAASANTKKPRARPGSHALSATKSSLDSERKLQSHLPDARITGVSNPAEVTTVDVATRTRIIERELSVIEYIEKFRAKFQSHPFADPSVLVQGQVPVIKSRTMEEAPVRVACDADGFREKWGKRHTVRVQGDVEETISLLARVEEVDGCAVIVRYVGAVAATERGIVTFTEGKRETRSEACNSRKRPTGKQLSLHPAGGPGKRQLIAVAEDKVVSQVELRKGPAVV